MWLNSNIIAYIRNIIRFRTPLAKPCSVVIDRTAINVCGIRHCVKILERIENGPLGNGAVAGMTDRVKMQYDPRNRLDNKFFNNGGRGQQQYVGV